MGKVKILYFMPDNPLRKDAGNKIRALQILDYFKSRSNEIELSFVSERYWGQWTSLDEENFKKNFPMFSLHILSRKLSKKNKLNYFFRYKIPNAIKKNVWLFKRPLFPNNNTIQLQNGFNTILKSNVFDYIIISYSTWATLVHKNPFLNKAFLINDTHDFITAQNKLKRNFKLGRSFEEEIRLLSVFNEIWSVSSDEQNLFSQFLPSRQRFIPVMYKPQYQNNLIAKTNKKEFDLLYIGSENENNIRSINWFFTEVYPNLSKEIKICVIGKIGAYIPEFPNVTKFNFAESLKAYYEVSKIAICPMLTGTGIKVKVVEAMSYGLPIVCSFRGLDGLPIKNNNGCLLGESSETFAVHIQNLLSDPKYYSLIQQYAIRTFNEYFTENKYYTQLDQIFKINSAN